MTAGRTTKISPIGRIPLLGPLLTGHWTLRLLAVLILCGGVALLILAGLNLAERVRLGDARIAQVDDALKQDAPHGAESPYCRRQFGLNQEYRTCLVAELGGYAAYARAWRSARDIGTWREQMINCLFASRRESGVSWAVAARCSESDAPGPDARN